MKKWAIVPAMGLIWIIAFAFGSGIGKTLDLYGKARIITIAVFLIMYIFSGSFRKVSYVELLTVGLILVISIYHLVKYNRTMLDYLWAYLLIPILSQFRVEEKQMRVISLMYGVLGFVVLYLANFHTIFKGWNSNSIGMIAFFSYMVFIGAFSETKNWKAIVVLVLYSVIYFLWMEGLNSRSCMLFSVVAILCVFSLIPLRKILETKQTLFWILLIPFLLAAIIVIVRDWPFVEELNEWSKNRFGKPIFNGRDELWAWGFRRFFRAPLFGIADLSGNAHNSAVTMLYGGGIVGFLLWFQSTKKLIQNSIRKIDDKIVFGLIVAFLTIWLQQSVELGLVAPQANLIPFGILGLLRARVRTLEENEANETLDPDSGL